MARRVLAVSILLLAGLFALYCGGLPNTTTPAAKTGTVYSLLGDSPVCDVLGARFNITELILYYAGSGAGNTLLSQVSTLIPIDLAGLRDSSTVLTDSTTTPGSYGRISLGFDVASMYVYTPSQDPPITALSENLTTPSPEIYNINPPLTVPAGGVGVVSLDFDLTHAVQVNSQGQITGVINPLATATASTTPTSSTPNGFGEIDGTYGFIESLQNTASVLGGISYIGGAVLQLLPSDVAGSGGTALTVELTGNSLLCGPSTFSNQACCQSGVTSGANPACSVPPLPLNGVPTGSYAAVDGFVDSNGYFEANTLTVGPQEIVADQQVAFIGPVLSIIKDTSGNVTGFNIFLREIEPAITGVSLDALTTVTLASGTFYNTIPPPIYKVDSPSSALGPNFAALPFGPDQIAVGEDVVVHGIYTVPPATTPPAAPPPVKMVANEVDLNLQAHGGNFVSLLAAQSDNRTGGFAFQPCATLDQQNLAALPIYVFTSPQTEFVNVAGLTSLQPQPNLLVKGLLFYEPQSVAISGVTVPAGKMVMLAKRVTQGL